LVDSTNVINLSLINLRDKYGRNDAAGGTLFVTQSSSTLYEAKPSSSIAVYENLPELLYRTYEAQKL